MAETGINGWTVYDTENQSGSLEDFMFRRYSPVQGRWISPDPAGLGAVDPSNPQSWNRYAYVLNNPLASVDPLGLECVWDDGSYDSADDLQTGLRADGTHPGCEGNGGQWVDHSYFQANGFGDWSGDPNSGIANYAQNFTTTVNGGPAPQVDLLNLNITPTGQISPLSTLGCAATFAPSLARTANIQGNTFLGKVGQNLLGNTFSGMVDLYNSLTSAKGTPSVLASLAVNGLRQGLPGGGPLSQGLSGVAQDATLKFAFQNLGAQRLGQATVNAAAATVGDIKVGYDAAAFAYAVYQCKYGAN